MYDKTIIAGMVASLGRAPAHELGSHDGVIALLSLRDQFVFLGLSVEVYIAGPWNHPEIKQAIESCGDHREMRQNAAQTGEAVLAGNVQVHLGKIRRDYESVARTIHRAVRASDK